MHQIQIAGDRSVLIRLGDRISPEVHARVRAVFEALLSARMPGVLNLHPAYASVLVDFDPRIIDARDAAAKLDSLVASAASARPAPGTAIEIPVCYGGAFGPDLEPVAAHCRLTPDEVIRRHSNAEYLVYFLGFAPGFPYLGGMDPSLTTPRLATPRKSVPAGSVAIGAAQTGIYPLSSPGGWRIIGRTPVVLFNPQRDKPALLQMGSRVRFQPITAKEFEESHTNGPDSGR